MKALIVDDEFKPADYLKTKLEEDCEEISEVSVLFSAVEALKFINERPVDLLFVDIEMPELSGVDLVELISADQMPHVIFVTAYNQYAVKAFEINAIDYLLKPVGVSRLQKAVKRVYEHRVKEQKVDQGPSLDERIQSLIRARQTESKTINVAEGSNIHVLKIDDIIRLKGDGSYTTFQLNSGKKIVASRRLSYYQEKLNAFNFSRTHKSHLVNFNYVVCYTKSNGGYLTLKNNETIPVSSSRKEDVLKTLSI